MAGTGEGRNGTTASPPLAAAVALVSEARARLADPRLASGLDAPTRAGLSQLFLDLSAALLLLEAAAGGDLPAARAFGEAERLDLAGQVARVLTPALRAAAAPALQVVLLQVASLAADVLARLELLAAITARAGQRPGAPARRRGRMPQGTELGAANDAGGPSRARPEAQSQKPRRRPAGRPRLHLVTSQD